MRGNVASEIGRVNARGVFEGSLPWARNMLRSAGKTGR